MIDRFAFHGEAVGLAGRFTLPFDEIVPVQASCALPEIGGYGSNRVDNFQFREIVSARSIYSQVAGGYSVGADSYDAVASVTIEDLNILNVITAQAVVARVASKHPNNPGEASIFPMGTHFVGLRIAGVPVQLDLATDTFTQFDTLAKVRQAYQLDTDGFRTEFDAITRRGLAPSIPAALRVHLPWCTVPPASTLPPAQDVIPASLVRGVTFGGGGSVTRFGHVFHVPGFGVIRLAEIKLIAGRFRLTMIHANLGSAPEGRLMAGAVEGNGSDW